MEEIIIIDTCESIRNYIKDVESGMPADECWEKDVLSTFWERMTYFLPFNLSERKPAPITNLDKLKEQCALLEKLDTESLKAEFARVTEILPNYDDKDPILVTILPGNPEDTILREKQNGVVGMSLFGNILIQINPLADNYFEWIKYVFAHEYHHRVWGNYWYVLHNNILHNSFIDSLVIDGEADSFALEVYPEFRPKWLFDIPNDQLDRLWEHKYKDILFTNAMNYDSYMFGSEEAGIPWCAGYAIGYRLVQNYLKKHNKSVKDIVELNPKDLVE
ncbi:MAG: DUF2268 domain-containing putative Zn-dependent protease [Butyrivibrio sp.]